ncbi:MAG TPA: signal recognition particle-docking protein FtsY, partial [Gemmatimonadaceae bacterium]|nr:signal recognition particle-docking protein FtsY [Gemmatimonadaceae bacterium]
MMGRILKRADDVPRRSLWQRIKDLALADVGTIVRGGPDQGSLERLEEVLLDADFGVPTTMR